MVAAAVDEHGVLSAWSITWVSAEQWDGAAVCTALQSGTNRTLSVAISKGSSHFFQPFPIRKSLHPNFSTLKHV